MKLNNKNNSFEDKTNNFLSKISYDNHQEDEIIFRIKLKGLKIHEIIYKFLINNKYEPKYDYIESIRVYDKRIRNLLFKYIGLIEEYLRAMLIDKFNNNYDEKLEKSFSYLLDISIKKDIIDKKFKKINILRNEICHYKFILLDDKSDFKNINRIILVYELIKILESNLNINDDISRKFI